MLAAVSGILPTLLPAGLVGLDEHGSVAHEGEGLSSGILTLTVVLAG